MSKRTYNQFCPVAYSLDIVGDRWTLLMVRELMLGPRRFTDLQRGLPGMGTNLLAQRLKDLEASGVIQQTKLPPPAATNVYELTEYGASLREVMASLTRWGLHLLHTAPFDDAFLGVVPAVMSLGVMYNRDSAQPMTVELRLLNEVFTALLTTDGIQLAQGSADDADLVIACDTKTLLKITGGLMTPQQALDTGQVDIVQGDLTALQVFADSFQLPQAERPMAGV